MPSISDCINWVALVISAAALYRTRKAGEQQDQLEKQRIDLLQHANAIHQLQTDFSKKQTEIAERQLDLNHQIAKHNAKANVVVSMIDEGNGLLLLFENKGMGDAANIYFEPHNNGKSRFIYKPLDHTNGIKLECLPSGARFTHPLQQADSILCQPHIQWVNPDGEEIKKPFDVCRRQVMRIPGKRVTQTRLVQNGRFVVAVDVEMVISPDDPSEPCLEAETVNFLKEVSEHAERGDRSWLAQHGKVYELVDA